MKDRLQQAVAIRGSRSLGPACFVLLGVFMALRAALPFLPSEFLSPSGYQCGSYYLFLQLGGQHGCVAHAAFGEGARVANRLDFVTFRSEKFTVDALGFRNPPLAEMADGGHPRVILTGSSFSLGLSLSDDETLAAQLNRRLGPVVYNASKVLNPDLSAATAVRSARDTGVRRGWVLLELLNRAPYGYDGAGLPSGYKARLLQAGAQAQSLQRRIKNPFALTWMTSMVNMRLQNDVLLPNPDGWRFSEEVLRNGRHMLFYRDDKNFFFHPAGVESTAASVDRLRAELRKDGLQLAVALVPSGYSAYWPLLLAEGGEPVADTGSEYMAELSERLGALGIPVMNCLPLLRQAAEKQLGAGELVYWPDDAHWNPKGVEAAADGIAPWLHGLLGGD